MSPETAQTLYPEMMNSTVAPFLRGHGFKRKGQQFTRTTNGYLEHVDFQKSVSSTREEVSFTVNLSVHHPLAQDEQRAAAEAAHQRWGRDSRVVPTIGNLAASLDDLVDRNGWWVFHDRPEMDAVSRSVTAALIDFAFPTMVRETNKPFVSPSYRIEARRLIGERHINEDGAMVGGVVVSEPLWPAPDGAAEDPLLATPPHTWPAEPMPRRRS